MAKQLVGMVFIVFDDVNDEANDRCGTDEKDYDKSGTRLFDNVHDYSKKVDHC